MNEPEKRPTAHEPLTFLPMGGEMGRLIQSMDWSKTPLGPMESWPQSLRTTVGLCLASNFPISIVWGPKHNQIYNDGYWPICGGKHPRSMGQDFRECWASAWPAIGDAFAQALAGQASYIENHRIFLDRNGYLEETFFTFSFSPIHDETGSVGGLFHPVTETTGKMLSERRTRALRDVASGAGKAKTIDEACRLVAQTLAEYELDLPFTLFYLLDAKGKNARLISQTGLPPGTAANPDVVDLEAPRRSAWPLADIARTCRSEQVQDLEQRFGPLVCGPYPESPKAALALPIILPDLEHPIAVLVAGVSSRLALNEAYRAFYDLLAAGVATAVANARAYEEEKKRAEALAELDRAKTAFFSNVSHEFRTPLTLIIGPLEDALADTREPWQRDRLELLHRNALRLQKLVNTLLDFSRIEAGRVQASYEPTELAAFTSELASVFRSAVEKAGMRLIVHCPPLSEPVYVDRDMYEKIVLNLLSNAFKFTLEGEIQVGLRETDAAVDLVVRDTGTGIASEQLPYIFERFHRVEGARARTHEGTGIGLALVQELVKFHGGAVTVLSVEGQGSTFTVTIPKGKAHLPADRINAYRGLTSTALSAGHYLEEALRWLPSKKDEGGKRKDECVHVIPIRPSSFIPHPSVPRPRIVWADDNADMREYVLRLLGSLYDVEAVADGEATLAAVRHRLPDLILVDVMMPRLDGFGLLRALRADEYTRAVPVILLSARAGEEARVEGMQAGAEDYLVKPFSARELLARVKAHVNLAQERQSAGAALRASEDRQAFLLRLSDALRPLADPDAIQTEACRLLGEQLGADRVYYVEVNEAEGVATVRRDCLRGASPSLTGRHRIADFGWLMPLMRRGETLVVPDVAGSALVPAADQPAMAAVRIAAHVNAPLVKDGVLVGAVCATEPAPRAWTPAEVDLVRETAERIWAAVERARAEQALRESEERLQLATDLAEVGFWDVDPIHDVLVWPPRVKAMFGISPDVPVSMADFYAGLHPDDRKRVSAAYADAADPSRRSLYDVEYRTIGKEDGVPRWVAAKGRGVFDETSVCVRMIGTAIDITERKQAEETLRQSEQALRDADRRKDEFLATLAHELRNPLAPIRNSLHILRLAGTDSRAAEHVHEMMERQVNHLIRLVDDLMEVSRITRGKIELRKEPVELAAIVRGAVETSKPLVEAAGHQLAISLPPEPLTLEADPVRLTQVLANLLNNAAKYTKVGGQIWLAARREGNDVVVSVRDNGMGIPAAMLPKVFNLFTQADRTYRRAQGGLGIGLTLVRGLVDLHGGSVEARSDGPGQGSEFVVRLPLGKDESGERRDESLHPSSFILDHSRRILIVDDNADAADSLSMLLAFLGADVYTANDGPAALEGLRKYRPSVVLLDIGMPGMDGTELARRARQQPEGQDVTLIALTGWGQEEDRRRFRDAGIDHHLLKPVNLSALQTLLISLETEQPR